MQECVTCACSGALPSHRITPCPRTAQAKEKATRVIDEDGLLALVAAAPDPGAAHG
jgi:hypothetical protein